MQHNVRVTAGHIFTVTPLRSDIVSVSVKGRENSADAHSVDNY